MINNLLNMRVYITIILCLVFILPSYEGQARTIRIKNNLPLSEQIKDSDATYVISNVIDLSSGVLEMPANSTLKFRRKGVLQNGYLCGNKSVLSGRPHLLNVRLSGTFDTRTFYASWCQDVLSSDFFSDVMNLGLDTKIIVDKDVYLSDSKRSVSHLYSEGKGKTVVNSDRFSVTYGGCVVENLKFRWNKPEVVEPNDNYSAVIIYSSLLQKDTTINVRLRNLDANGGRYCSFFMKQYKSSISPNLKVINDIENSRFTHFTRGAIWTCGGTGRIINTDFENIGYETTKSLYSVFPLRLGYAFSKSGDKAMVAGYEINNCLFKNTVAAYSSTNDGRELHGLIAYGDSLNIYNNRFITLSTSFRKETDPGMDAEILYIKGSYNRILSNTFKNGAGALSDGMITIKIKDTEKNIVKGNELRSEVTHCRFMQVGGRNHIIEGNSFSNKLESYSDSSPIALYLIHYDRTDFVETVQINNNSFEFSPFSSYLCVYANNWGNVSFTNNTIVGASQLYKNRGSDISGTIDANVIVLNNVRGKQSDRIIDISEGGKTTFYIVNNTFKIHNSTIGCIVSGKNYSFCHNNVLLEDANLHSLLRGQNTDLEVLGNTIELNGMTTLLTKSIIGEKPSKRYIIRENNIRGKDIANTLKK